MSGTQNFDVNCTLTCFVWPVTVKSNDVELRSYTCVFGEQGGFQWSSLVLEQAAVVLTEWETSPRNERGFSTPGMK